MIIKDAKLKKKNNKKKMDLEKITAALNTAQTHKRPASNELPCSLDLENF